MAVNIVYFAGHPNDDRYKKMINPSHFGLQFPPATEEIRMWLMSATRITWKRKADLSWEYFDDKGSSQIECAKEMEKSLVFRER